MPLENGPEDGQGGTYAEHQAGQTAFLSTQRSESLVRGYAGRAQYPGELDMRSALLDSVKESVLKTSTQLTGRSGVGTRVFVCRVGTRVLSRVRLRQPIRPHERKESHVQAD